MNWYNPTEGTWVVSGEFATSSILAGSGIWIEDAKGSGNLLITYTASGAKVFSSGVLQFSTLMAPAGVVTLSNKGTLGSVEYHPRAFTDAEAIALATGDITVSFTLRNVFNNSPQGVWYDPSDTTTLFQDSAGTTPVTASGQPVGLMLDKSKGLALGPELVVNGTFDTNTSGWVGNNANATWSWVSGGSGLLTTVADFAYGRSVATIPLPVGTYKVSFDITSITNPSSSIHVGLGGSGNNISGVGHYEYFYWSNGTSQEFKIRPNAVGTGTIGVANISVKRLAGNHAIQPTAGKRPMLGREPFGGRRNLLLNTDALSTQSITVTATPYTLKFSGAGTVALSGASTMAASGAGTYTFTPTAGTLTLTVVGSVTFAQAELGSTATPYQKVVSSFDVTEAGKPDCWYIKGDGIDDYMYTGNIDFTGTDKMTVWAGVGKTSNSVAIIAELSNNSNSNDGSFFHVVSSSPAGIQASSRGTAAAATDTAATAKGYPVVDTSVSTATHDIAASLTYIYRNGVASAPATGAKGSGNFGNYPLNLLARGGLSYFFSGNLYSLIIRGAASSADELSKANTYTAKKTGVTL